MYTCSSRGFKVTVALDILVMEEQIRYTCCYPEFHALEKEMATHSCVLAWEISGKGSLVGCHLWGHTESDTTEVT